VLSDLRVRGSDSQTIDGAMADLADVEHHATLFDSALASLRDLDAVLVAYGTLPDQEACESSVAATLEAMTVNGTSAVSLLTHAANLFEARGKGVIAAISSVAADRGRGSNYVYGAGKSLLSTFMQGLRHRLAGKGIRVVTIKPGFVDTPMTAEFDKGGILWSEPAGIAAGIVRAMDRSNGDVYLPWFWFWIMVVIRHIPERVFLRLKL
jgi:short-subunit dehydrogenase